MPGNTIHIEVTGNSMLTLPIHVNLEKVCS